MFLRQFVNCQEFIDKNYAILNTVIPLRDHLNKATQLIVNKVTFLLNNTILLIQDDAKFGRFDRTPIQQLATRYAQYSSLLSYAQVMHYYQDLEELQWKLRTSIETFIVKASSAVSGGEEIHTIYNQFLNIAYITTFMSKQDEEARRDPAAKDAKIVNNDIFYFRHNMEQKKEYLGTLLIERFFYFLMETLNRIKKYEFKVSQEISGEQDLRQFVDDLRAFAGTFREKWQGKLREMMLFAEGLAQVAVHPADYWPDVEKEIHAELLKYVLGRFLELCGEFDAKVKSDIVPADAKQDLMRGLTTLAAIHADSMKYVQAIQRNESLSTIPPCN